MDITSNKTPMISSLMPVSSLTVAKLQGGLKTGLTVLLIVGAHNIKIVMLMP